MALFIVFEGKKWQAKSKVPFARIRVKVHGREWVRMGHKLFVNMPLGIMDIS